MKYLSTFIFITVLFTTYSYSSEKIGKIRTLDGVVTIKRGNDIISCKVGTTIFLADIINTDKKSTAGIIFNDNTMITLDENSSFEITDYKYNPKESDYSFHGKVLKGKILFNSGRISKIASNKVALKTPSATVGVKGTKFIVGVAQ